MLKSACNSIVRLTKCQNIDITHCAQSAVCFIKTDDLLIISEHKVIQNKRTVRVNKYQPLLRISFLSNIPRKKKRKMETFTLKHFTSNG